ncbi:MAG: hypothetical protein EP298_00690 [Gammaproteobacteria bacterium]|nr:MAG: hypothetical protein EP298_00690 [Gammaproteobacteria bacterium]UTW41864.1 hypothetical protein KFE69_10165 [bacterium SCSIO 12844]
MGKTKSKLSVDEVKELSQYMANIRSGIPLTKKDSDRVDRLVEDKLFDGNQAQIDVYKALKQDPSNVNLQKAFLTNAEKNIDAQKKSDHAFNQAISKLGVPGLILGVVLHLAQKEKYNQNDNFINNVQANFAGAKNPTMPFLAASASSGSAPSVSPNASKAFGG